MLASPRRDVCADYFRIAPENLLHPFQAFQFGQKFLAPRLAKLHDVGLVFYGEHQAEYGNDLSETVNPSMNEKYFRSDLSENDLLVGGVPLAELRDRFELTEHDLKHYKPLTSREVESMDLEFHIWGIIYPGIRKETTTTRLENGGFQLAPERLSGTYTKYCSSMIKWRNSTFIYRVSNWFGLDLLQCGF